MIRQLAALALFAWLAAIPAHAQYQSTTPEAQVREILNSPQLQDQFEIVTTTPKMVVRHNASRLVCRFEFNQPNAVRRQGAQGVACESITSIGHVWRLFATPAGDTTLDAHAEQFFGDFRSRFSSAQPLGPPVTPNAGALAHRSAAFLTGAEGSQEYVRLSVTVANGWLIRLWYHSRSRDHASVARAAAEQWDQTLADVSPPPQ